MWVVMSETTSRRQLLCCEAWWEGSLEAKVGLDEQESDTRPMPLGKGAIDSEALYSSGSGESLQKSAEAIVVPYGRRAESCGQASNRR